jgi:purine/pyrimidine-nucleoside phosphorylase
MDQLQTHSAKANVYFDGKCVSHSITLADGSSKSVGVILPSKLKFNTGVAETMELVAGTWRASIAGGAWTAYTAGQSFDIPANSSFEVEVAEGEQAHYVCHFK